MIIAKKLLRYITYLLYRFILRSHLEKQEDKRHKSMVLVQINSGIGDFVLALPMVHKLVTMGYEVHALVDKYTETIARLCPDVKKYYIFDYRIGNILKTLGMINELNKLQFKYFIGAIPSNLIRDAFLPIIIRIPIRSKHETPHKEVYRNYDFLFNRVARLNPGLNNTLDNLMLLETIGSKAKTSEVIHDIVLPGKMLRQVKEKMKREGYSEKRVLVGMHPGCKETWAFKRWPTEKYAALIGRLAEHGNLQTVLFGGPEELKLAADIIKMATVAPINLVGKLRLEETMAAISLCEMFVSNDSALMHIATAFGVPVIALFGKTNEKATGPYGKHHVIIKKEDVINISVQEVYDGVCTMIAKLGIDQAGLS